MKKLYMAIALCTALLLIEAAVLLPRAAAKEDVVAGLLKLPAPPPPNPLARGQRRSREGEFYDKNNPPKDNAPTEDLLDYWAKLNEGFQELRYMPEPTDKVLARLMDEIEKDPAKLSQYLNVLPRGERSADFVKRIYDSEGTTGAISKDARYTIKNWLIYNSPHFSNDLFRLASGSGDTDTYVTNQRELLALTRVDYDKARPIISRLQSSAQDRPSRVLAAWALYRHALDTDSLGDIDRYRDELKAAVENRNYPAPMRDLAMDALVSEKEWAGRDEWYMSLLSDPTLADMGGYTGLTTLMLISPPDKYSDRMVELLKSDDAVVRAAAVRNLISQINAKNMEVIKAMLPWLEDPKWAPEAANERRSIVEALRYLYVPESVPGLLKVLDEKSKRPVYAANTVANAANAAANVAVNNSPTAVRAANIAVNRPPAPVAEETYFPYRSTAIWALLAQKDARAVPSLRRILPEVEVYERTGVVSALLASGGFTVAEQLAAVEAAIKDLARRETASANTAVAENAAVMKDEPGPNRSRPVTPAEISLILGSQLFEANVVSDELAAAVVDRIGALDGKDPNMADLLRRVVIKWQNTAINLLMLHDAKRDRSSVEAVTRLLSMRKKLREELSSDVADLRTGTPTAIGLASCLLEDAPDQTAILEGGSAETKTAMLACARLIRAPLPVAKVAEHVRSGDKRLALAAELYLESEDSPAARAVVLSLHPGEAKILGATTAFMVEGGSSTTAQYWTDLYNSVVPASAAYPEYAVYTYTDALESAEEKLVKEVKEDASLLGVYSYDGNFVHIYADRAVFSWDYDASRHRERVMSKHEFDELKAYLTEHNVDELAPFLTCPERAYCEAKELVMLSRNGGRRVYVSAEPMPAFFQGLDKYFADMRLGPGAIRYALSKDIPGLEIVFADDNLHVETVWKEGDDLRIAVTDRIIRKRVSSEIDKAVEDAESADPADGKEPVVEPYEVRSKLTEKRAWEGYSWRKVVEGADAGPASQPPGIEIIPLLDTLSVAATVDQWKSRVGDIDYRADSDGLFKATRGKLTRIRTGYYATPVTTSNGRWLAAYKYNEDSGAALVRIDLLTNREYDVETPEYTSFDPVAYVSTINKFLLVQQMDEEHEYEMENEEEDDTASSDPEPDQMMLLDPLTGALRPISGEFRPLAQQTFRPLQKAAKLNEYWAALPDVEKNVTQVGIYDTKTFGFKSLMTVPKVAFNSMNMWVDEPGKSIYFVYRGHLLRLPMGK